MMKKVLVLTLVLAVASANASVLYLRTTDLGTSGGRLGTSELDALQAGDVVGLEIVLAHHSEYPSYPSYDGYILSSFDVSIAVGVGGTIAEGQEFVPVPPPGYYDSAIAFQSGLTGAVGTISETGIDTVSAISLDGLSAASGDLYVFKGIEFTCGGDGNVDVDLILKGLSQYASYVGGPWTDMTEEDLGDLTIYQVPEPMTVALLGLGGLFIRRKKA